MLECRQECRRCVRPSRDTRTMQPGGVESKALLEATRSAAVAEFNNLGLGADLGRLPWPPGSPSGGTEEFLRHANDRALCVTMLQGQQVDARELQQQFDMLLADFPECCPRKFGEDTLGSSCGRAQLVLGLVKKHTGELVELHRRSSGWQLRAVAPGSASASLLHGTGTPWLRREGGGPAGRMDFQFGCPGSLVQVRRSMRCQHMDMVERHGIDAPDMAPDLRV